MIREKLREIDKSEDIDVTAFESEFLDSVLYKYTGPLSKKQRAVADQMIERYL